VTAPLDNTAEVETPEHIRFRYRVAGPTRRALAYVIDLAIRAALMVVVGLAVSIGSGGAATGGSQASAGLLLVFLFALEWGYYVFFDTIGNGASPGKRALGLRVVKEGGFPVGWVDSVLRNLLRAADFLPVGYVLGLLSMAGDTRFRRLGDRVAGTMVVVSEAVRVRPPLALQPPPAPGELEALPMRLPLSADEREAIELYLRRSDLAPARRTELAQMVAPLLARRMGVPLGDPVRLLALCHLRATGQGGGRPA
jgi:uncharacterized RDD family membrane protein YckC